MSWVSTTLQILGAETANVGHKEKWVSALGGFVGIGVTLLIATATPHAAGAPLLVASMGATAVLVFAVPHGALSQPWPVFGGHLVSALIGVLCAHWIPDVRIAAPLAVGAAIGLMYYLRCVHPPGGATALYAVTGGASVHALGFGYALTPVLVNTLAILGVAIAFNAFFPWRRYPVYWQIQDDRRAARAREPGPEAISHDAFVYALTEMHSFIDVTEHDLLRIYDLATRRAATEGLDPAGIRLGHCYSNGKYGEDWSVRQIIQEPEPGSRNELVVFKTVAGRGRRQTGVVARADFAKWAKYEVFRDEENWRRVDQHGDG